MVSIILCSLFCYLRRVYQAQRWPTTLLKHFIYHTGISSIGVGAAILTSTYCLYRYYRHTSKILSVIIIIIVAVVQPLVLLILSAVFLTLLSIRHQNGQYCQKICKICCKCKATPQERPYTDSDRNENQTNPPSNPLIQPSHTYSVSVPYTGAFTQVTSDEHYRCIGEHTPLISSGNYDQ